MGSVSQEHNTLDVDLSIPITGPGLPELDMEAIFELLEDRPLHDRWSASLPEGFRKRRLLETENGFDRRGRLYQIDYEGELHKARELLEAKDWSSTTIGSMATTSANPSDGTWFYDVAVHFVVNNDTGEFLARWSGLRLHVQSPTLLESLSEQWVDVLWDFMLRGAQLLGAVYGYARTHHREQRDFTKDYLHRYYGLPPRDPDDIPGVQWICLIPPAALEKLGGWQQCSRGAPVERASPLRYDDDRIGALLQATRLPQQYDESTEAALRSYLNPVLRSSTS